MLPIPPFRGTRNNHCWAVLSDEQMSNGYPFSLLNDEQMSNKVGVKHQPELTVAEKRDSFNGRPLRVGRCSRMSRWVWCCRINGDRINGLYITDPYKWRSPWGYNPLILTFY